MRCVTIDATRGRALIAPCAFTTRCQGIVVGQSRMARPTSLAPRDRPRVVAS
jgi:hypothetical protein